MQPVVVERVRADETDFLLRREDELDSRVRPVLGEHAPDALEHLDDRSLVVGAEDRSAGVPDNPVLDDRFERPGGRHRIEVRAEEERRPLGGRLEADVDVSHRRADLRPAAVLVRLEPEVAQVAEHDVGDGTLLARRAGDRGELEEEVEGWPLRIHLVT